MPLKVASMRQSADLAGRAVFISASIPDPNRWQGDFDPLEITDAATAAAGAILTASGMVGHARPPGLWKRSLERLRQAMLEETQPVAGVFIGGMEGVPVEHSLFTGLL